MKNSFSMFLDNLRILFSRLFRNKLLLIFIAILAILFIILSVYLFNDFKKSYFNKKHVLNKEYLNKTNNQNLSKDNIEIIYFYTEWCPYCKKAKPEWEKFSEYIKNFNNDNEKIYVKLTSVDCDKEKKLANKYNINGYPTIKLIKNNKVNDYDARPNKDTLVKFLESYI